MKLTLKKGEMDDWYTIERAEHANIHELRPHVTSLYYSGRISDACVEGTSHEMMGIATAIITGASFSAKRCAVKPAGEGFLFWSPRNSMEKGYVDAEDAKALAEEIKARLFLETP